MEHLGKQEQEEELHFGPSGVRALADVMVTKLGIISLFFFFPSFYSFHILFSQKEFAYNSEFLHVFLSNKKNKI